MSTLGWPWPFNGIVNYAKMLKHDILWRVMNILVHVCSNDDLGRLRFLMALSDLLSGAFYGQYLNFSVLGTCRRFWWKYVKGSQDMNI